MSSSISSARSILVGQSRRLADRCRSSSGSPLYIGILVVFVPRLQRVSAEQADARAQMTGRIVDSYTNIQTVKLFAHTRREQDYARDAMDEFMAPCIARCGW